MNSVELIGRITKNPEVKYGENNQNAYCRFNIAIDRGKDRNGNDMGADFPTIVAFGKVAENMEKYLSKGDMVGISGRIHTGKYEKDGKTVYTSEIYANRVEFLVTNNEKKNEQPKVMDGFSMMDDSDIPF